MGFWKSLGSFCGSVIDNIPVAGHIKGAVHLLTGNVEKAQQSFTAATRPMVVLAASAAVVATGGAAIPAIMATQVVTGLVYDKIVNPRQSARDRLINMVTDLIPMGGGTGLKNGLKALVSSPKQMIVEGLKNMKIPLEVVVKGMVDATKKNVVKIAAVAVGKSFVKEVQDYTPSPPQPAPQPQPQPAPQPQPQPAPKPQPQPAPQPIIVPEIDEIDDELYKYYDTTVWEKIINSNKSNDQDVNKKFSDHANQKPGGSTKESLPPYKDGKREDEDSETIYNGGGGGQDPPKENQNGKGDHEKDQDTSELKKKLKLFLSFLIFNIQFLKMPAFFRYTTVLQRHNCARGLLHNLFRHRSEFANHIVGLNTQIQLLSELIPELSGEIMSLLNEVDETLNPKFKFKKRYQMILRDLWSNILKKVPKALQRDFKDLLEKIQQLLYEFLTRVMTNTNYVGITFNNNGAAQVIFRIDSSTVLVVGVSDELYWRNPTTRPVREIITIFIAKNNKTIGARKVFIPDDDPTRGIHKCPKK